MGFPFTTTSLLLRRESMRSIASDARIPSSSSSVLTNGVQGTRIIILDRPQRHPIDQHTLIVLTVPPVFCYQERAFVCASSFLEYCKMIHRHLVHQQMVQSSTHIQ